MSRSDHVAMTLMSARGPASGNSGCPGPGRRRTRQMAREIVRPIVARPSGWKRASKASRMARAIMAAPTAVRTIVATAVFCRASSRLASWGGVNHRGATTEAAAARLGTPSTPPRRPPMTDLSPDYFNRPLAEVDPEIADVLVHELERQQRTLEMIASENFVPQAVLEAVGSVLTNKYAEGYPGKRYYGGCEYVDVAEQLAIDRAKSLFGAEHANVQPHAGASANAAVLAAIASPGDRILGLELAHGGHLTHGMKLNFSGKLYEAHAYGVDPQSYLVDMDVVREKALELRPKVLIAGWSAYPRQLDFAAF